MPATVLTTFELYEVRVMTGNGYESAETCFENIREIATSELNFGGFYPYETTVRRRRWWRPRNARHCGPHYVSPLAEPREPSSESVSCNFTKNPTVKQHCPPC